MVTVGVLAAGCSAAAVPAVAAPFVYVANKGHGKNYNVSQFDAAASGRGALTPLTPATVSTGPIAEAIAVSPQGNSAYVVSLGSHSSSRNEISQYSIDLTRGRLTPKSPATVATGKGAYDIALAPNGKSAYVTNSRGRPFRSTASTRPPGT
jgi:DNA-binding beta-propeller fold protein YncE